MTPNFLNSKIKLHVLKKTDSHDGCVLMLIIVEWKGGPLHFVGGGGVLGYWEFGNGIWSWVSGVKPLWPPLTESFQRSEPEGQFHS